MSLPFSNAYPCSCPPSTLLYRLTSAPRVTNPRLMTSAEPQNYYFESLECGRRCLLTGILGGLVGRGGVPCQSAE